MLMAVVLMACQWVVAMDGGACSGAWVMLVTEAHPATSIATVTAPRFLTERSSVFDSYII
jgi:hypothetical protein